MLDTTDLAGHIDDWLELWRQAERTYAGLPVDTRAALAADGVRLDSLVGAFVAVHPADRDDMIAALEELAEIVQVTVRRRSRCSRSSSGT